MKKLLRGILAIALTFILIPALYAGAVMFGTTVIALINSPEVMSVILGIFLIISIPGIIIGLLIKKFIG